MRERGREDKIIQLMNRKGVWRGGHTSDFGQKWGCPERARDNYARVISSQKWPLKKRTVITHIKARSKHSSLTATKKLIRPDLPCRRIPGTVCSVCVCVLLLPIGRGLIVALINLR